MRHFALIAPILSLSLLLASCGGTPTPPAPVETTQPGTQPGLSDFTLSLNPGSVTLAPGETKTVTVNVSRSGSFAGEVALSADVVPGLSATLSGTTLRVTNTGMTGVGATLTVRGVSGTLSRNTLLNVSTAAAGTAPALDLAEATLEENGTVNVRVLNLKYGDVLKYGGTAPGVTQTYDNVSSIWTLRGATSMIAADVDQTFLVIRDAQTTTLHLKLGVNGHKVLPPSYPTRAANAEERRMLDLVNGVRASGATCGGVLLPAVPALIWDETLFRAAFNHSQDQLARKYYDHVTPEGVTPGERAFLTGYRPLIGVGENIFWMKYRNTNPASASTDEAFKGWMNSEGHCRNIMNGVLKNFGVAFADQPTIENSTDRMWSMSLAYRD